MIIGLTGTYCAGKNYVGRLLEKRGLPVLDVDKLGHSAIETEKEAILERFGEDILSRSGSGAIDRKLLGAKVFGRPSELAALEAIVHPAANRMTVEWLAAREGPCVINAALLHRSEVFRDLDAVILVEAPWLVRLFRARKRDRLSWKALLKRFKSQKEFRSQYFGENTDIYRVENRGFGFSASKRQEKLERRIDEILSHLGL
ncbi:MAG: dephospho-CoA kinase [Treponema sp.]|jgi:dephospho-CoA kinase|nr:dephospho-CoA kinase [Treponema sp.]